MFLMLLRTKVLPTAVTLRRWRSCPDPEPVTSCLLCGRLPFTLKIKVKRLREMLIVCDLLTFRSALPTATVATATARCCLVR